VKINVSNIPPEGLSLQFSKDAKWLADLWPDNETMDFTLHESTVSCSLKKVSETVFIEGKVQTTIDLECCRCLEVTKQVLDSDFKYTFAPTESLVNEEIELSAEDLEISYYDNDIIDLNQIAFEQIVLQIPMKALCSETCKGLCPICGINLNTASCSCQSDFVDDRLAVLKQYKVKP
jgi:uncharacterized protein